jgi:hypothetical protein
LHNNNWLSYGVVNAFARALARTPTARKDVGICPDVSRDLKLHEGAVDAEFARKYIGGEFTRAWRKATTLLFPYLTDDHWTLIIAQTDGVVARLIHVNSNSDLKVAVPFEATARILEWAWPDTPIQSKVPQLTLFRQLASDSNSCGLAVCLSMEWLKRHTLNDRD